MLQVTLFLVCTERKQEFTTQSDSRIQLGQMCNQMLTGTVEPGAGTRDFRPANKFSTK